MQQAASAIENLKMESPAKKINFQAPGKENAPLASFVDDIEVKKPVVEEVKVEKAVVVAPTIKPEEADEPLLQENPQRFVLFPIKYHEVSRVPSRAIYALSAEILSNFASIDLADVQESRGFFLDRRRD